MVMWNISSFYDQYFLNNNKKTKIVIYTHEYLSSSTFKPQTFKKIFVLAKLM